MARFYLPQRNLGPQWRLVREIRRVSLGFSALGCGNFPFLILKNGKNGGGMPTFDPLRYVLADCAVRGEGGGVRWSNKSKQARNGGRKRNYNREEGLPWLTPAA